MSYNQKWRINVKNLETFIPIGIHPHEKKPQRVIINAVIEGNYPLKPRSIDDCFNYEHIHRFVVKEWPLQPHVFLMETSVVTLLNYIFNIDQRVTFAKVSLCKPDILLEAQSVGVEAEWTRADFERCRDEK
jgi:dihydroneopterin aldolase